LREELDRKPTIAVPDQRYVAPKLGVARAKAGQFALLSSYSIAKQAPINDELLDGFRRGQDQAVAVLVSTWPTF
jgi:hypothetical protein